MLTRSMINKVPVMRSISIFVHNDGYLYEKTIIIYIILLLNMILKFNTTEK